MFEHERSLEDTIREIKEFYNSNNFIQAIELSSHVLKYYPDHLKALKLRGESFRMTGKYSQAVSDFILADKLKPGDAKILALLGSTQIFLLDFGNAIKNLKLSLDLDEENGMALQELSRVEILTGKYEAALKHVELADELDPNDWLNQSLLGVIHRKLGNFSDSYRFLKCALMLSPPTQSILLLELAETCREMKHFDRAFQYIEKWNQESENSEKESSSMMKKLIEIHLFVETDRINDAKFELEKLRSKVDDWADLQHFEIVSNAFEQKNFEMLKLESKSSEQVKITKLLFVGWGLILFGALVNNFFM